MEHHFLIWRTRSRSHLHLLGSALQELGRPRLRPVYLYQRSITEVDVPVGKVVRTNPGNAFTTRLRLVRQCGPFFAALHEIWMRHSTRNAIIPWYGSVMILWYRFSPMSASAGPAPETNLGSISFGGEVGTSLFRTLTSLPDSSCD